MRQLFHLSVIVFYLCTALCWAQESLQPDKASISEPSRNYDLQKVTVRLQLDVDNKSFTGEVINLITPLFADVRQVRFDAVDLKIHSITLQGKTLNYQMFEESPRKGIEVQLDKTYSPADTLPITISYSGQDPKRGLYFIQPSEDQPDKPYQIWTQGEDMDTRYYVPTYDYPNDRTTTEFFFTVREPLYAVSNGTLVGVKELGEKDGKQWRTFHWKMDQPYVTYLFALAAADWEKYTDTVNIPGRKAPLSVEYYVNQGVGEETARRSYSETPRMLQFFSEKIGVPFPWDKYAQATVTDFVVGGMENASLTLNTDLTLHDERAHLDTSSRGLVAHELAHQWWGDLLTCRKWADLWLNEGFATYFECLYSRAVEGEDEFRYKLWRNQNEGKGNKDNPRPIVESFIDKQSRGRGSAIYTKGAATLYMLHHLLGEDLWWKAIKHYATKHAYAVVDTHDFQIAVREATGADLDWFFQQWVYLAGYPMFEVSYAWDDAAQQVRLTVKQTQKAEDLWPIFRVPVEVAFTTSQGVQSFQILADAKEQNFYFAMSEQPLLVRFDKDSRILKELNFDKPIEMLCYQLQHDTDVIGRLLAAQALGKHKEHAELAVNALSQALQGDSYYRVRAAAAESLGKIGGENARLALLAGVKDGKSAVRQSCAQALAEFVKDSEAAKTLEGLFLNDPSYVTQSMALESLAKLENKEQVLSYIDKALTMNSHRDQIATQAMELLAKVEEQEAVEKLLPYLNPQYSGHLRRAAASALADAGKQASEEMRGKIVEAIVDFGNQDRTRNRFTVMRALGKLGDKRAIPFLEKIANDLTGWDNYNEAAKRAIEQIQGKEEKISGPDDLAKIRQEMQELRRQVDALEKRILIPMEASAKD